MPSHFGSNYNVDLNVWHPVVAQNPFSYPEHVKNRNIPELARKTNPKGAWKMLNLSPNKYEEIETTLRVKPGTSS